MIPTKRLSSVQRWKRRSLQQWQYADRRTRRCWILGVVVVSCTLFWFTWTGHVPHHLTRAKEFALNDIDLDQPPTYEGLRKWEKNLPQHDLELPYPEGRSGRYVHFASQVQQLGWNNQLNEVLMNTWLAHESKRAYVFQDYIWKNEYYPWPRPKAHQWPPRTPANALISGPSVGGSWDADDPAPRSVSQAWFDIVCPKHDRRIINTNDVKPAIQWERGDVIFNHWKTLLLEAPERCIEIQPASRKVDGFPQVFDLFVWGSDRILPLWESFKESPVSRLLKTSPIIEAAVARNEYLFMSRTRPPAKRNAYDRMLAIHLRRGDFKEACLSLANWNSTFYSWNLVDSLPDPFINPPGYTWGKNTPENVEYYLTRCYPTDNFIIDKVNSARDDYERAGRKVGEDRNLDVLYLLTNDKSGWVDQLKEVFKRHGWRTIVTTWDLELDAEQKDVGMGVDMDIARRAAVFIGNGWSSFTSNIVHRRLVDGKEPISIRFY